MSKDVKVTCNSMAKTDQTDGNVQRKDKNRNVTIFLIL